MTRLSFDPKAVLIIFQCQIEHERKVFLDLALDTGASTNIISRRAAEEIGFDLFKVSTLASFGDASQAHIVPKVTLKSLSLADAKINNIDALCYTIPEEHGIDGVIGLNFLRHFKVALDFQSGTLTLEQFGAR